MKTSISSEALTQFVAEKIAFPPKPDGHRTDGQTEGRTDGRTDGQKDRRTDSRTDGHL